LPSQRQSSDNARRRQRHALVVLLTVNAGATDAIGFLALGGAFTSVMTGNLVLFGISAAKGDGTLARHILTAVLCFIGGCILGSRLAGVAREDQPIWPPAVTRALGVEFVIFAGYAVGWWAQGSAPRGVAQLALLGGNAIALGVQSSSVQRFGVPGLSTTYMTGTLTTLIVRLTSGHRVRDVADSLQILGGLIAGAIGAAALVLHAPVLAPVLQLTAVGGVLVGSLLLCRAQPDPDGEYRPAFAGRQRDGQPSAETPGERAASSR
jgi:Predicted membrane protein